MEEVVVGRVPDAPGPPTRSAGGRGADLRAEIAETIASAARQEYRSLAHEEPDFIPYFREATPIDVIERLRILHRGAQAELSSLPEKILKATLDSVPALGGEAHPPERGVRPVGATAPSIAIEMRQRVKFVMLTERHTQRDR